jgi:hypothetical protein
MAVAVVAQRRSVGDHLEGGAAGHRHGSAGAVLPDHIHVADRVADRIRTIEVEQTRSEHSWRRARTR